MKTITLKEYHALLKAQGTKDRAKLCMICPLCGTVQCGNDLIAAGAGKTFDDVEKYLGFSCIGRWTHGKPPPAEKEKGQQIGCNWTLGGLLQLATLQVATPDGRLHPRFEVATHEQAQEHWSHGPTTQEASPCARS